MVAAMRLPVYIFIAAFAVIVGGCTGAARRADAALARADSLIAVSPDSALAVLNDVSPTGIGRRRQARLSLLRAKAKSKCYLPLREDSAAIADAAQFYRLHGDSLAVQSQFYLGELLAESGYDSRALVPLHNAYDLAKETGDHFYAGMSARALGSIYGNMTIVEKGLEWSQAAYDHFVLAEKPIHAEWMKEMIADAHIWNGDARQALEVLDEVDSVYMEADSLFRQSIMKVRADALTESGDYEAAANELLKLRCERVLTAREWTKLGHNYYNMNRFSDASAAIDSALEKRKTSADSIYADYVQMLIAGKTGSYEDGYCKAVAWGKAMMTDYEKELINPQTLLLTDYLKLRVDEETQAGRELRKFNYAVSVICVLLVVIGILSWILIRRKLRDDKDRISNLCCNVDALRQDLSDNRELAELLMSKDRESYERTSEIVNRFCSVWFVGVEVPSVNRKFKKELDSVINYFKSDETITALEDSINLHHGGWMSKFKSSCQGLNQSEYRLVLYLYIGFSNESIAMLTERTNLNAVYVAKNRLGKKIVECAGIEANEILAKLYFRAN